MIGNRLTNEEKLDAIYEMTLQNHEVLKTIRRQQYISGAFRTLYWLIVLGVIGSSYYFIRPFIGTLSSNASQLQSVYSQFKDSLPETKVFNTMMEGIKHTPNESANPAP